MAKAYYNHLTNSKDADSAGTEVEMPGENLADRRNRRGGTHVLDVMKDEGIDISEHAQTQLLEEMLDNYDRVISMADHKYTPEWLRAHTKFEYWHIEDPGGKGPEETKVARNGIKRKVEQLIAEMHESQ